MSRRAQPGTRISLTDGETIVLADASEHFVGTWVVQLTGDTFDGSVDVQGRVVRSEAGFKNIDYRLRTAVNDPADSVAQLTHTDIGTGIIIVIDGAGLEVQLACAVNSGTLHIDVAPPLIG